MGREPNFERLRTALLCGEPDYVPLVELGIAQSIKEGYLRKRISGMADEIEFWRAAGYDYVKLQPIINMNPGDIQPREGKKTTPTSEEGTQRKWASEHSGIITSEEEFERYVWPTPDSIDYSRFEAVKKFLPDTMKVIGQYGDIFTMVWEMMGFENFSMALYENPELVGRMFDTIGQIVYNLFENMVEFDCVEALWYSDDIAYANALIISPTVLRQYFFPWLGRIGELARQRNLPFLYHTDGVVWDVFDDIIACGVHAIHPVEPKAMDIVKVKERVKGKLCVIGNVDLGYTLTRGTPEETADEVKEKIRLLAPEGGYCLGSSNSVPDYVKVENYRAMVETTKRFGKYPISL
jgi:uroporphyrinogen decarboxylase